MYRSLKKYPKISGYLDRISKIWIMKKFDIQIIQVSMYPKKMDIHVSNYPCIQVCMISKYPIIQVSKKNQYPRYPSIRISEKSGIRPSLCLFDITLKLFVIRKLALYILSNIWINNFWFFWKITFRHKNWPNRAIF